MSLIFEERKNNEYSFAMNFEHTITGVKLRAIASFQTGRTFARTATAAFRDNTAVFTSIGAISCTHVYKKIQLKVAVKEHNPFFFKFLLMS